MLSDMDPALVQVLVQGGALGIALLALWIIWNLMSNHMDHNTEALHELSKNITSNTAVLHSLKDAIDRKL